MKQKWYVWGTLLLALVLLVSACGGVNDDANNGEVNENEANENNGAANEGNAEGAEGESHTFRLTTIVSPDHTWTEAAEKFNEELQERSGGRLEVDIYPASQLGTEAEMIQQMSTGSVDFGIITNSYLSSRNDSLDAWFMPMLFSDGVEEVAEMRDSESAQELLDMFEAEKLIGMDWIFSGNHSIMMREGAMDHPDAFEGQLIRAPETSVISDFYDSMGASAEAMPLTEVYSSLQSGVVDGVNGSAQSAATEAYYEIAQDFTLSHLFAWPAAVLMSQDTFDGLSEEDQEIVFEAMEAAIDFGNERAIEEDEQYLQYLEEQDVTIHRDIDQEPFQPYIDDIYEKYSAEDPIVESFIEEASSN